MIMLIAATAALHGLTLATRNERDFEDCVGLTDHAMLRGFQREAAYPSALTAAR